VAEIDALEVYRSRPLDVQTTFANWRRGWDKWLSAPFWRNGLPELLAERGIRISHSTPLLCEGANGQFAECARGDFDDFHRSAARRWHDLGHPAPIIRLGWETTLERYPWNALQDTSSDYQRYKDAFRRIADIYHHELPGCLIDWNNLRRPQADITKIYPGDDWVDIIGADLYGNRPAVESDEDWEKFNRATSAGGPASPSTFADFARSRGKKFGVAEWAITNLNKEPNGRYDSPRYIRGMWEFFVQNQDILAYECYFNREGDRGDHRLYPDDSNPRASATYRQLWSACDTGCGEVQRD
jgi:hypothetical protein